MLLFLLVINWTLQYISVCALSQILVCHPTHDKIFYQPKMYFDVIELVG